MSHQKLLTRRDVTAKIRMWEGAWGCSVHSRNVNAPLGKFREFPNEHVSGSDPAQLQAQGKETKKLRKDTQWKSSVKIVKHAIAQNNNIVTPTQCAFVMDLCALRQRWVACLSVFETAVAHRMRVNERMCVLAVKSLKYIDGVCDTDGIVEALLGYPATHQTGTITDEPHSMQTSHTHKSVLNTTHMYLDPATVVRVLGRCGRVDDAISIWKTYANLSTTTLITSTSIEPLPSSIHTNTNTHSSLAGESVHTVSKKRVLPAGTVTDTDGKIASETDLGNSVLSAIVHDRPQYALDLYHDTLFHMPNFRSTVQTYNTLLIACTHTRNFDLGVQIFSMLTAHSDTNARTSIKKNTSNNTNPRFATTIDLNAGVLNAKASTTHAHTLTPTRVTYNKVIRLCCASERFDHMAKVVLMMWNSPRSTGIRPDVDTISVGVDALVRAGQWERAIHFFNTLAPVSASRLDTRSYNTVLKAYGEGGRVEEIYRILKRMRETGVGRDTFTYNTSISAFAKLARLHDAEKMFYEMRRDGVRTDSMTYTSLMDAANHCGSYTKALDWFSKMKSAGVTPGRVSYMSALRACEGGGWSIRAIDLFEDMRRQKISPTDRAYVIIFNAYAHLNMWEDVVKVVNSFRVPRTHVDTTHTPAPQVKLSPKPLTGFVGAVNRPFMPGIVVYNAALSACLETGQWRAGMRMFDELVVVNFPTDTSRQRLPFTSHPVLNIDTYNLAISLCGAGGHPHKAMRIFESLIGHTRTSDRHLQSDISLPPPTVDENTYATILRVLSDHGHQESIQVVLSHRASVNTNVAANVHVVEHSSPKGVEYRTDTITRKLDDSEVGDGYSTSGESFESVMADLALSKARLGLTNIHDKNSEKDTCTHSTVQTVNGNVTSRRGGSVETGQQSSMHTKMRHTHSTTVQHPHFLHCVLSARSPVSAAFPAASTLVSSTPVNHFRIPMGPPVGFFSPKATFHSYTLSDNGKKNHSILDVDLSSNVGQHTYTPTPPLIHTDKYSHRYMDNLKVCRKANDTCGHTMSSLLVGNLLRHSPAVILARTSPFRASYSSTTHDVNHEPKPLPQDIWELENSKESRIGLALSTARQKRKMSSHRERNIIKSDIKTNMCAIPLYSSIPDVATVEDLNNGLNRLWGSYLCAEWYDGEETVADNLVSDIARTHPHSHTLTQTCMQNTHTHNTFSVKGRDSVEYGSGGASSPTSTPSRTWLALQLINRARNSLVDINSQHYDHVLRMCMHEKEYRTAIDIARKMKAECKTMSVVACEAKVHSYVNLNQAVKAVESLAMFVHLYGKAHDVPASVFVSTMRLSAQQGQWEPSRRVLNLLRTAHAGGSLQDLPGKPRIASREGMIGMIEDACEFNDPHTSMDVRDSFPPPTSLKSLYYVGVEEALKLLGSTEIRIQPPNSPQHQASSHEQSVTCIQSQETMQRSSLAYIVCLFESMFTHNISLPTRAFNTGLNVLVKRKEWECVLRMCSFLGEPTVETYTARIQALVNIGMWKDAVKALNEFVKRFGCTSAQTPEPFMQIMRVCARQRSVQEAALVMQLYDKVNRESKPGMQSPTCEDTGVADVAAKTKMTFEPTFTTVDLLREGVMEAVRNVGDQFSCAISTSMNHGQNIRVDRSLNVDAKDMRASKNTAMNDKCPNELGNDSKSVKMYESGNFVAGLFRTLGGREQERLINASLVDEVVREYMAMSLYNDVVQVCESVGIHARTLNMTCAWITSLSEQRSLAVKTNWLESRLEHVYESAMSTDGGFWPDGLVLSETAKLRLCNTMLKACANGDRAYELRKVYLNMIRLHNLIPNQETKSIVKSFVYGLYQSGRGKENRTKSVSTLLLDVNRDVKKNELVTAPQVLFNEYVASLSTDTKPSHPLNDACPDDDDSGERTTPSPLPTPFGSPVVSDADSVQELIKKLCEGADIARISSQHTLNSIPQSRPFVVRGTDRIRRSVPWQNANNF
eukprot:CFRG2312T1